MTVRTRLVAGVVCALLVCLRFGVGLAAASGEGRRVEPFGAFEAAAIRERPVGYRVLLWREGSEILGLFSVLGGKAKGPPTGRLEDVDYAPSTGHFVFRSHLWLAHDGDRLRIADADHTETQVGRSAGIHGADFRAAMTRKFLAETDDPCDTENKVTLESVQYGDLHGEPGEEALVAAFSCLAGNSGVDLWAIFRMDSAGKLQELPINHSEEERASGKGVWSGLRGHVLLRIDSGRFIEEYPLYAPDDPNSSPSLGVRRFIYRWDGHRFVLAKTEDVRTR